MVKANHPRMRARDDGKKYYQTGVPCRNGHTALRRTDNGRCVQCQREFELMYTSRSDVRERIRMKTVGVNYNISTAQWQQLMKRQNGKCAGCDLVFGNERWNCACVDHDHETGEVRGLLCTQCNLALGHVKDDPEILRKHILYLRRDKKHKVKIFSSTLLSKNAVDVG